MQSKYCEWWEFSFGLLKRSERKLKENENYIKLTNSAKHKRIHKMYAQVRPNCSRMYTNSVFIIAEQKKTTQKIIEIWNSKTFAVLQSVWWCNCNTVTHIKLKRKSTAHIRTFNRIKYLMAKWKKRLEYILCSAVCVNVCFISGGGIYLVKNSYCVHACLFMLHWTKWNHIKYTICEHTQAHTLRTAQTKVVNDFPFVLMYANCKVFVSHITYLEYI